MTEFYPKIVTKLDPGLSNIFCYLFPAELTASHFGGGVHKNASQKESEDGDKPKSRKELIEELIAKSKQEKVGWLMFLMWTAPKYVTFSSHVHLSAIFNFYLNLI